MVDAQGNETSTDRYGTLPEKNVKKKRKNGTSICKGRPLDRAPGKSLVVLEHTQGRKADEAMLKEEQDDKQDLFWWRAEKCTRNEECSSASFKRC